MATPAKPGDTDLKTDLKWAVPFLLVLLAAMTAAQYNGAFSREQPAYGSWQCPVGDQPRSDAATCKPYEAMPQRPPGQENLGDLTRVILSGTGGGLVVALEALAVLLVAALVAALVIAIRERPGIKGGEP